MHSSLQALSPLDGRYLESTKHLREFFSEQALIQRRARVEIEWLKHLVQIEAISHQVLQPGDGAILDDFNVDALEVGNLAERVKELEKKTNHDVKAVEYYLRDKLSERGLSAKEHQK